MGYPDRIQKDEGYFYYLLTGIYNVSRIFILLIQGSKLIFTLFTYLTQLNFKILKYYLYIYPIIYIQSII